MCILEYCISIDWMDSPILSSIHHAHIIYKGSLKHMSIRVVFSELFVYSKFY
jgi:hypothetical protein